jgi:hypothetical protein
MRLFRTHVHGRQGAAQRALWRQRREKSGFSVCLLSTQMSSAAFEFYSVAVLWWLCSRKSDPVLYLSPRQLKGSWKEQNLRTFRNIQYFNLSVYLQNTCVFSETQGDLTGIGIYYYNGTSPDATPNKHQWMVSWDPEPPGGGLLIDQEPKHSVTTPLWPVK